MMHVRCKTTLWSALDVKKFNYMYRPNIITQSVYVCVYVTACMHACMYSQSIPDLPFKATRDLCTCVRAPGVPVCVCVHV